LTDEENVSPVPSLRCTCMQAHTKSNQTDRQANRQKDCKSTVGIDKHDLNVYQKTHFIAYTNSVHLSIY